MTRILKSRNREYFSTNWFTVSAQGKCNLYSIIIVHVESSSL